MNTDINQFVRVSQLKKKKKKKKRGKLINSILLAFVSHGDRESITKTKKRTE